MAKGDNIIKNNKYMIKYTLTNRLGRNEIFYSYINSTFNLGYGLDGIMKDIYDSCIEDVKKSKGLDITKDEIEFHMISLLDTTVIG
jgi:hypothetical protein